MHPLGSHLRRRAEALGLSNAEVARRAGLSERRYANYVAGTREPDLATLVRIAAILGLTPDQLLGVTGSPPASILMDRLILAAQAMGDSDLESLVVQAEAVARLRAKT
ncbi:helix-turn-helix domain-containing protein [Methylobacterium komagatae]|uniref:Helix-turn-helix domain-containing protein n=1 Tax=Methylobacterium komagatae TaxID=374425 RepID=A0ABW2BFZ4_9HYPH